MKSFLFFVVSIIEQSSPRLSAGNKVIALLATDIAKASWLLTPKLVNKNTMPNSVAPIPAGISDIAPIIRPEQYILIKVIVDNSMFNEFENFTKIRPWDIQATKDNKTDQGAFFELNSCNMYIKTWYGNKVICFAINFLVKKIKTKNMRGNANKVVQIKWKSNW